MNKIFYNQASAVKLGWSPEWFGVYEFDEELIKAIRAFQRENKMTADGLCGPTTYRRIWTERESKLESYLPPEVSNNSQ